MKKTIVITLLVLVLTACATASAQTAEPPLAMETAPATVTAEGRLLPHPSVELAFAQGGVAAEVLVQPGQRVEAGQPLARLENIEVLQAEAARAQEAYLLAEQAFGTSEAEALRALSAAHEAVRRAQVALDDFDVPSKFSGLTPAEAASQTWEQVEKARADYEPYRQFARRPPTRAEYTSKEYGFKDYTHYDQTARLYKKALDSAWADYRKAIRWAELEADLHNAKASVENFQREFESLTSAGDASQMSVARARFESARASLEAARAALSNAELRAPFAGTVLSLDLSPGEAVVPGAPVAFLADTAAWTVDTKDLAEIDIARVALGQTVTVKLDAFPGEAFSGKVTDIDPVGREYLGDMTYKVTVTLDDADGRFMWNMTAIVTIDVE